MKYAVMNMKEAIEAGFEDDLWGPEDLEDYDIECRNGVFEVNKYGVPVRLLGTDGGEPEDNYLCRDWNWVAPALNEAYEAGRKSSGF